MNDDPKPWRWWFPAYVHTIFFIRKWFGWRPSNESLDWVIKRAFPRKKKGKGP